MRSVGADARPASADGEQAGSSFPLIPAHAGTQTCLRPRRGSPTSPTWIPASAGMNGPSRTEVQSAHVRRSFPHPQLLYRGPYRPRQEHAFRPPDPDHRRPDAARDDRAGPGLDGYRARARDHHQGANRPPRLQGERRPRLRAEPDRHPRARRLRLRGLALAHRLRGLHPGGRRQPGRGGADAGQRLPGHRGQPRDRAGAQQDRPARRRRRPRQGADRGGDRHRRQRRRPGQRQDRPGHSRDAGGHRHPPARPQGRRVRPPQGAPGRRLVRPVPGRGGAGARVRRRPARRPADQDPAAPRQLPRGEARRVPPQGHRRGHARPRRDRLHHRRHQGGGRRRRGRHPHRRAPPHRRRAARLQGGAARGVLRPVPRRRRRLRRPAQRRGPPAPQRRQLHLGDGDQRRPGLRLPLRLLRPAPPGRSSRSASPGSSTST